MIRIFSLGRFTTLNVALPVVIFAALMSPRIVTADSKVHIISNAPVDLTSGSPVVHLLTQVGTHATTGFQATTPDTPTPDEEFVINGGPFWLWQVSPTTNSATVTPTNSQGTTFDATSSTPNRTYYTVTVQVWWTEVSVGTVYPYPRNIGASSDSITVDASFIQPGIQIYANGNWQSVDGTTITLLHGTTYPFRFTTGIGYGIDTSSTSWSGIASGTGATITISFNTDTLSAVLSATFYGATKSVTINVVTPSVASMIFVDDPIAPSPPLYDPSTGANYTSPGFETNPSTSIQPACFIQNRKVACKVQFWHTLPLTFATKVNLKGSGPGDASAFDLDYTPNSSITFGTSWRSPSPGALCYSQTKLNPWLRDGTDGSAMWTYTVQDGYTHAAVTAGTVSNLQYVIIYDQPKLGIFAGASGAVAQSDITYIHLTEAVDLAATPPQPVTPDSIAGDMTANRGWAGTGTYPSYSPGNVPVVWDAYRNGDWVGCWFQALGLAYGLHFVGIDANVAFANLLPAVQNSGSDSGDAIGTLDRQFYEYTADSSVILNLFGVVSANQFEGCVYLTNNGARTWCYDPPHADAHFYWELGNDKNGGPSGNGLLFRYTWFCPVTGFQSTYQNINGAWLDSLNGPLQILKAPPAGN